MIAIESQVDANFQKVSKAVDKAAYENLGHALASIRKAAIASIETSSQPSAPGKPVHSKKGLAKKAIFYAVDKEAEEGVVGFSEGRIGEAMAPHELGGSYKGTEYPARPTMGPALDQSLSRFAESWQGSIGQ